MDDEKLCLKWDDFQDILSKSFGELRLDNDFTDVTLVCEDQSIKAHKVILAACSPFFKRLLKSHPHSHPLVLMRGIKSSDLVALVDFLYLGEANIFQEQLQSFLALAEEFELKELTENFGESMNEFAKREEKNETLQSTSIYNTKYNSWSKQQISQRYFTQPDEKSLTDIKKETKVSSGRVDPVNAKAKQAVYIGPGTMAKIQSMVERVEEGYSCTVCDYTSKRKSHIMEHVEKHIEGLEYPCNFCNKVWRSSHSFRDHIRRCVGYQNSQ